MLANSVPRLYWPMLLQPAQLTADSIVHLVSLVLHVDPVMPVMPSVLALVLLVCIMRAMDHGGPSPVLCRAMLGSHKGNGFC